MKFVAPAFGYLPDSYGSLKRMMRVLRKQDVWQFPQVQCERIWLGNKGARWCVCPNQLSASSVIYSFGVGEDISFDLETIRHFGVQVHAFDPTPRSIEWLAEQTLPEKFMFHPYGVADFDGTGTFHPPVNPGHISHTLLQRETPWPTVKVPLYRLASIMKKLGHKQIDLLKMDIEGTEYGVIADFLASGVQANQLLIEFHHRWPQIGIEKTKQAIRLLNNAGFQIFNISPSGEEYSFLRKTIREFRQEAENPVGRLQAAV